MPRVDNSLITGFQRYLASRVSENTVRDYVGVVSKREWPPVKRAHIRAWRSYIKYLFSIGRLTWEEEQQYLAFLKTPKLETGMKKAVDETIIAEYIVTMKENKLEHLVYLLLGGSRLSHIVYMLNNYNPKEIVKHPSDSYEPRLYCVNSWCRYYLGIRFGSKRCNYIYYPRPCFFSSILDYRKIRDKLRRIGVQVKVFRKYVNQKLEQLAMKHNIRLDAVNLIMSRELSVTGAHYLDTRSLADKLFSIYTEYLKKKGLI